MILNDETLPNKHRNGNNAQSLVSHSHEGETPGGMSSERPSLEPPPAYSAPPAYSPPASSEITPLLHLSSPKVSKTVLYRLLLAFSCAIFCLLLVVTLVWSASFLLGRERHGKPYEPPLKVSVPTLTLHHTVALVLAHRLRKGLDIV